MKYLTYVFRNIRRNPVRSMLTVSSMSICLFLMMILYSFFAMSDEASESARIFNRIASLNANGFAGKLPIAYVKEVAQFDEVGHFNGVAAITPFSWYGGKYKDEILPFAQFAVDPHSVFTVMNELTIPDDQLKAFAESKDGCVIGRKLAFDKKLKVGDPLPLKGDAFPVDLDLTIRGIYDGPSDRDLRMCLINFEYFDEALKRVATRSSSSSAQSRGGLSGNAGMLFIRCRSAADMPVLCKKIDDLYRNSDFPLRTQTEEAFGKMFEEMMGDLKGMIFWISTAVVFSLLFVAGNSMAMSMRERTTEVAVLKAIGFNKGLLLLLVMTESILVAGAGGVLGSLGCKGLCDYIDLSRYTAGFLPFFYVPWSVALFGLAVSLLVGFLGGIYPAFRAATLPVVDGLRKVI
jgi:putative ABC transport system permease protein